MSRKGEQPAAPGTAGRENGPAPGRTAVGQDEQAPALRGLSIAAPRRPESTLRRRILQDLRDPDHGCPYRQEEAASPDLTRSSMERQDRMNGAIANRIAGREYRSGDPAEDAGAGQGAPGGNAMTGGPSWPGRIHARVISCAGVAERVPDRVQNKGERHALQHFRTGTRRGCR